MVRVQLISIIGAVISLLYQETTLSAPSESSWYSIMVSGLIVIALLYAVAIPMYYRKWYAFILAPVFTALYFLAVNVMWLYFARWTAPHPQYDLGAGILLFFALVAIIIGVIVGSAVGTAIGSYTNYRRSKKLK